MRKPKSKFDGIKELEHNGEVLSLTARLIDERTIAVTPEDREEITIKVPEDEQIVRFFPSVQGDTMVVDTDKKSKGLVRWFYDNRTGSPLSPKEAKKRPMDQFK